LASGDNFNIIKVMIPIKKHKNKPYLMEVSKNKREKMVQENYYKNGWVVLKNGWPDLFCYNPKTQKIELVEVKSKKEYKETKKGRRLGLSRGQLRMHQYLKKAGFIVKIIHI
jgi:hypothetical protein